MLFPRRKRVLFVSKSQPLATFERMDLEFLRERFYVRLINSPFWGRRNILRLFWNILWADIAFSWFADWHSYWVVRFCRLLGKKSIVVAGGFDTAEVPEIGYGISVTRPEHRWMIKETLGLCDRVILNSAYSGEEITGRFQIPQNKMQLIYPGQDSSFFKPNNNKKEKLVITVGALMKHNLRRKGLQTFVETAAYLPEYEFILAGKCFDGSGEELAKKSPANVRLVGFLPDTELLDLYQRAKVYVQVSLHETFAVAMAEAMLCECVPVITKAGALPEVVGDCGIYVPAENALATATAIKEAANRQSAVGPLCRERIRSLFPLQARKIGLWEIVEELNKK